MLEVEMGPLLAPLSPGTRGGGPTDHSHERIDWRMTSLLFFFPALGGLLFGCGGGRPRA